MLIPLNVDNSDPGMDAMLYHNVIEKKGGGGNMEKGDREKGKETSH